MQIISTTALLSINETLIIQLISFLIFLFIINRIMFRPLQDSMHAREGYCKKVNADITAAEDELKQINRRIHAQESAVKLEAFQLKDKIEGAGSQEASRIFASAREEIAGLRQDVSKQIDHQISEVRKELKREAEVLAVDIMEKIVERRLAR